MKTLRNPSKPSWGLRTKMIHGGVERSPHGETSEGLYLTSGYVYDNAEVAKKRFLGEDDGYMYSRYGNPTVETFQERMTLLEGAEGARATATGMAAVTASFLCFLKVGEHVVASRALFGSCRYVVETLLPRLGITSTLVDGQDLNAWKKAVVPGKTKAFFLETPCNPTLSLLDISAIAHIAHEHDALLIVDNVFATPILQKPLTLGADVCVYSTTKHIDGQGRCLGGVILGSHEYIEGSVTEFLRQTGPSMSPFNAWVFLKGLETLDLRIQAHCQGAEVVARWLCEHPKVIDVLYPGLPNHPDQSLCQKQMTHGGSMMAFRHQGGEKEVFAFLNRLEMVAISNNLGDTKSLITHPATTTHHRIGEEARRELSIGEDLVRLSVGLEDPQDIIADLKQALE